ncbi:Uncharacterized protein AArcCO_1423 [Halalkaliarchaeum sp. AArc-CO]|uniref:NRDE family protein n=1 Tax=unclassified Halalkaliarchaeum TaxID=2678344 RepID=UPI00217E1FD6|nr:MULTISPECIES: NRDE family protein [unclassified Halalkaliarchaeum]MDR5674306.1 NRDE family protein [Halalkaliarchaeum sp. AArc-GB]UWG50729.1 Uncharacterized protein AArcCO_1423 [Halalkaliarchaeum sp. AArc-CO]
MCTLTLAWQVFPDAPIVAAANRDEATDRPSSPPKIRSDGIAASTGEPGPAVLAPVDDRAGGTWIGLNDRGVFAAITNRWNASDLKGDRSRGLLVADCLRSDSATDAARHVERELDRTAYEGFNLVLADAESAHLLEWTGRFQVRSFAPGVHVVVNVGADGVYEIPHERAELGETQAQNADELRARLQPEPGETADRWLDRAGGALGDHEAGVCVHGDGFGTRSSSLVRLSSDGDVRYDYADGPPCETPAEPVDLDGTFTIEAERESRF